MSGEVAGVSVAFGAGADVVGEAVSFAEVNEKAGAHGAAEGEADELENRSIWVTVGESADAEGEVGLVGFFVMEFARWKLLIFGGS